MPEQLPDAAPSDPMGAYAVLYPDVVRAGSLRNALQAAVDRAGYPFVLELTSSPGWRHVAARMVVEGRSARVLMAQRERCFIVDCWAGGVRMASGETGAMSDVVGAVNHWSRGPLVRELVEQWPFLRTWELAEAHERGEAVPVRWRQLRDAAVRTQDTGLHELLEAAAAQPRLRALSPGRSLNWLTFSRRATPPICQDLPRVTSVGGGRYRVRFADGRLQEVDGAVEAVSLILDGLPGDAAPDCP